MEENMASYSNVKEKVENKVKVINAKIKELEQMKKALIECVQQCLTRTLSESGQKLYVVSAVNNQ